MSEMPTPTLEDLTPEKVERWLLWCLNQLTLAQTALRLTRDAEIEAEHAYQSARRKAFLSPDCPVCIRPVTAAERDAWIDREVEEQELAYKLAKAKREAAGEKLRTLRDQASIIQSLGVSVRTALALSGVVT